MSAFERMERLEQVLDEHRRTVPVARVPEGTAFVELGDGLLWCLSATDGTRRGERLLSPTPVDACVHLPASGEIVWIVDTGDGVMAAAAAAGDGHPLRRTRLPQWVADCWIDLVAGDLDGAQAALLLVGSPAGDRCLVDPFSGAVAARWTVSGTDPDAETTAFAARRERWWRWERRVGVRPVYSLHDDTGRAVEFPGTMLDVRGTVSLWSVPAPEGSVLVLHDAADGTRQSVRTEGEALAGVIEAAGTAVVVTNRGARQCLARWHRGARRLEALPGVYGELALFATETEAVFLAEESLLGGVRHLELSGSRVHPRRLGPQHPYPEAESVDLVELSGGRSWAWVPPGCRGLVVSLHGGPESGERDGLRYAGLYRELLAAGVAVVVWNYPSSTGFGTGWRSAAHGDWATALGADLELVLDRLPVRVRGGAVCLFGVSFGAWAALQVAAADHDRRPACAVLSAPMLDLESHRQRMGRAAELAEFTRFFDDTFGTPNGSGYRTAREILEHGLPVLHIVHGVQDEVVDAADTAGFCERAAAIGARVSRVALEEQGHAPQDPEQAAERYGQVLDLLLQCLDANRLTANGTEWS